MEHNQLPKSRSILSTVVEETSLEGKSTEVKDLVNEMK
jgi:hypothetical protein